MTGTDRRVGASRREWLRLCAAGGAAALAGCGDATGSDANARADVVVGPDTRLTFDPAETTVGRGERMTWYFDSRGHNVSCRPADADPVELPAGAEPFATYGPDESWPNQHLEPGPDEPAWTHVPSGETYARAFEIPGTYVYACVPHVGVGMVGRVVVEG